MLPYDDARWPVREDLATAHAATVVHWAAPGTWWTAEQRLALVSEARRARAAPEAPAWHAPSAVEPARVAALPVPAAAVDAVWRITRHPGSLVASWYESIVGESGVSVEQYVELVGIVAEAASLDSFARAIGVAPLALPDAAPGAPTHARPDGVAGHGHWVPIVDDGGPNVTKALSLVPAETSAVRRLAEAQYLPGDALMGDLAWSRGRLDRMQTELIAARTSALNECFY
ncbi:MAG TPA: alkylhydroperoxidase-related (seleno)protein [Acidimicrobiia bacterium]|nr:alkylhydroperoxidase-related (seleno)protein [Acidimicrobiia bacterium]